MCSASKACPSGWKNGCTGRPLGPHQIARAIAPRCLIQLRVKVFSPLFTPHTGPGSSSLSGVRTDTM